MESFFYVKWCVEFRMLFLRITFHHKHFPQEIKDLEKSDIFSGGIILHEIISKQ